MPPLYASHTSETTMNRGNPRCAIQGIARLLAAASFVEMLLGASPAHAEMSAEELAKLAQNPVGNLISLPFQNNTNLNFGPEKGTQNILNIQPVIPISVRQGLEHHHAHDPAGDLACRRSARASTARAASATPS